MGYFYLTLVQWLNGGLVRERRVPGGGRMRGTRCGPVRHGRFHRRNFLHVATPQIDPAVHVLRAIDAGKIIRSEFEE